MASAPADTVKLQLGDIVELVSPSDENTNGKQYLIQYIDSNGIDLLGADGVPLTLDINEDGSLLNESITGISILSRADEKGYAKQNSLVPDQWIDIHFGGDLPTTFTGKVTSLDEDQIEVTLTDGNVIYIDFAYKGIPKDIPIDKFVLRDTPESLVEKEPVEVTGDDSEPDDIEQNELQSPEDEIEPGFKERVKNIMFAADQIRFGTEEQTLERLVEVPAEERRYGIDKQTNDLLAEMLSDIPNNQRTTSVLNNIHRMIERFKQLRTDFSTFDENGNASMPESQGADYKPLVGALKELKQKLYWIVPVVRNKKKLFDVNTEEAEMFDDIVTTSLATERVGEDESINAFNSGRVPDGENGYNYLLRSLKEYWTPFENPSPLSSDLTRQDVGTNLNGVVDMLEDFYSSVAKNEQIKRKRFLIQRYNLGENTLEAHRVKGGDMIVNVKEVTRPDSVVIKSFLTLPKSAVTFSRVNLPATDIMTRSNLASNFMPYWRLLNKGTSVRRKVVESAKGDIGFEAATYLAAITEYSRLPDKDISYDEYLKASIPKTRVLFDLVKSNIKGRLSLYEIVSYLEPFMVYHRDLSFMQYYDMVEFVTEKISDFRRDYATSKKEYDILISSNEKKRRHPTLLDNTMGGYSSKAQEDIIEAYDLTSLPLDEMSNGELLKVMGSVDYSRFYNSMIGLLGSELMIQDGMAALADTEGWLERETKVVESKLTNTKCESKTLAKKYTSPELLIEDNGKTIYFDIEFDKTFYDVIRDYQVDVDIQETDASKRDILKVKLIENTGMTPDAADREAEALLLGKRPVRDGDIAVLVKKEDDGSSVYSYFQRKDNQWLQDESAADKSGDTSKMYCDLEPECITVDDKCESLPVAMMEMQKDTIKDMADEFDKRLQKNADAIFKKIKSEAENARDRLPALLALQKQAFMKYDILKYSIGQSAKEVLVEESPNGPLISTILSQGDFVKRQNDITKFVAMFTRPANDQGEDVWWLYCISSGIKILPTFVAKLADAFVRGENYMATMARIISDQGDESGDGEAIIDRYSSWVITTIDFSTEEGFTEDGFAMKTRDVLAADVSVAVAQQKGSAPTSFGTMEAERIFRVMNAISKYMGLDTESLQEFVMSETSKLLAKSMPSKADYEAAAAASRKKKKPDPYETVYNQTLILMTIAFLLIGIQTSVPPLRTRKTFPGCVRSFAGYPSKGTADKSGLEYIVCVANGIKSSIEPWDSIKKLTPQKMMSKIETYVDKLILTGDMMRERVRERTEYDDTVGNVEIPDELSIANWINFLPPLRPVKVGAVEKIPQEFREQLKQDVSKGSSDQFLKIDALRSKIIYTSLAIQEGIQKVLHKDIIDNQAVLSNAAKDPFLENACCNSQSDNTFDFFASKDPSIISDNNTVLDIRKTLDGLASLSRAPILFDPENTSTRYPALSPEFDEETIYRAFIVYCKYNSDIPLSEELRAVCMDKPDDFDVKASIAEHIAKLKRDGRNYNNESLARLMSIVNRDNIVNIDLGVAVYSNIQRLRSHLSHLEDTDSQVVPLVFREKMVAVLDRYGARDGPAESDSDTVRDLKNYLGTSIPQMEAVLTDFVRRNSSSSNLNDFIACLGSIPTIREDRKNTETSVFRTVDYAHNAIQQMTRVFPNIIIDSVNYNEIPIPRHWKLSERHAYDIQEFVKKHYSPLSTFYGDARITEAMKLFQTESLDLERLAWDTMYLAPRQEDGEMIESIFDQRLVGLLMRFYILSVLVELAKLVDRDELYAEVPERPSNPMLRPLEQVDVAVLGDMALQEVMTGDKKETAGKIANIITAYMSIVCGERSNIDHDYESLKERVTRAKEKEKDGIVARLTAMTDDQRDIDKEFRNHKLGVWAVGQQKGFRVYEGDTYDAEREAIEERTANEMRLGTGDGVTDALMDVFVMDMEANQRNAQDIEREEFDMTHIGEDNDGYGEMEEDDY